MRPPSPKFLEFNKPSKIYYSNSLSSIRVHSCLFAVQISPLFAFIRGWSICGFLMAALLAHHASADDRGLAIPDQTRVIVALHAEGVQIYEAKARPDGALGWSFVGPEAKLETLDGREVGQHSIGPVWKANDGSEVKATKPALEKWEPPDPGSVAWLLLEVNPEGDAGLFSGVNYVMRIATVGGAAPTQAPAQAGERKSVPYQAVYLFLSAGAK